MIKGIAVIVCIIDCFLDLIHKVFDVFLSVQHGCIRG